MAGTRLESGPARTDALWHLARAVLFVGFGLYCIYDGTTGYPNRNRAEALKRLQDPNTFNGQVRWEQLGDVPDLADWERVVKSAPKTRADVLQRLGLEPTITIAGDDYFISRTGYVRLSGKSDRVSVSTRDWVSWYKTRGEIRTQFVMAAICAVPGLYFIVRLIRAVTLRVVIDEDGMTYAGRRIPFADMISLRDYNKKGWIDLYYRADGKETRLRLDNEKVARFDEIVEAICQAKGFRNEVKIFHEEQARRAADAAAARAAEDAADAGEPRP